jgi:hypothetical protein
VNNEICITILNTNNIRYCKHNDKLSSFRQSNITESTRVSIIRATHNNNQTHNTQLINECNANPRLTGQMHVVPTKVGSPIYL